MSLYTASNPLRIGILGAARIAPMALVRPARGIAEVRVAAVAARDPERARRFAARHGIPQVHASYRDLLADPDLDAIYNPLPNALHCEWTLRALDAGKHVLCEKPMASNAEEAERMAEAAEKSGRILVEAFHYRYHPLATRLKELVESGELGELRHLEASLCIPMILPGDIRYRLDLSGGALMDTGCYALNLVRYLAGSEPEIVSAWARLSSPQVDRCMQASLRFEGRVTGRIHCSLFSASLLRVNAKLLGSSGEISVLNPFAPQLFHRLRLRGQGGTRVERVSGDASYTGQLRAFVEMVGGGAPMPTDAGDAVKNMRAIDAIYREAGLRPRG
jgi:predicted dehydrogenase